MKFINKLFGLLILAAVMHSAPVWAQTPYGQPIVYKTSSATEGSHIIKATGGVLYSLTATNVSASAGYILVFDSATVPADGAVTPVGCYAIGAASSEAIAMINYPDPFNNGIVAVFSSTGCNTKTVASSAWFRWQVI